MNGKRAGIDGRKVIIEAMIIIMAVALVLPFLFMTQIALADDSGTVSVQVQVAPSIQIIENRIRSNVQVTRIVGGGYITYICE